MRKKSGIAELFAFNGASGLTREIVQKFIEKIVVADEEHLGDFWKDFAFPECRTGSM